MDCIIDGCTRMAKYKNPAVCQTHYHRKYRTGTYDLIERKARYRRSNAAGYQRLHEPLHPLANSDGYVYEHRMVFHDQKNSTPSECAMCGCSIEWSTLHIDHINEDVTDNSPDNLRAVCRGCNVMRGHTAESMGKWFLTVDGETRSATGWSRHPDCKVSPGTITRRMHSGMSHYDAVFAPKKTHTKKAATKRAVKYDHLRGIGKKRQETH